MNTRKAFKNFIIWISIAILVNIFIGYNFGEQRALEFFGGYIIELSLSIDNLFLFLIIFSNFKVPPQYQQRVLNYGILGAVILRLIFIYFGITLVNKFNWMLYIFGILLIISGLKILFSNDTEVDLSNNKLLWILKKILPLTNSLQGEKFFVKIDKVIYATPLFLILVLIESSDVIFALDSIPAIFAITTNPYIVYTSNILAILGLRSLYFLLVKLNSMFKYIQDGVAYILVFTGIKLTLLYFSIHINTLISLLIIAIILLLSLLLSLIID